MAFTIAGSEDLTPLRPPEHGVPPPKLGIPLMCVAPCPLARRSGGIPPCAPDWSSAEIHRSTHDRWKSAWFDTGPRACPAQPSLPGGTG